MITEKCILPIGVEYEGKRHNDLEIRPRLVRDLIDAAASDRAKSDGRYYELCQYACQIVSLGDIPKDQITGELILDMFDDDFDALVEAANRVRNRTRDFCGQVEGSPKADTGASETGVPAI